MLNKRKTSSSMLESSKKSRLQKTSISSNSFSNVDSCYAIKMPNDFYPFWNMCLELNPKNPLDAFSIINLKLVGPFYFIKNDKSIDHSLSPVDYHMKWRFYYDSPEFLTVFISENDFYHIGYFRDNPNINECVVAENSGKDPIISVIGDNLFAAVRLQLMNAMKKLHGFELDNLKAILEKVQEHAQKENFDLKIKSSLVSSRKKKVVANSFHKAGIVVPIVNEVGYRPLPHNNLKLKQLFKKVVTSTDDDERLTAFEPIQEMINYIQFANDECDYGMGLELGIDLFCDGSKYFFKTSERLLTMAYQLLKRDLYAQISKAHFADRRNENFSRI